MSAVSAITVAVRWVIFATTTLVGLAATTLTNVTWAQAAVPKTATTAQGDTLALAEAAMSWPATVMPVMTLTSVLWEPITAHKTAPIPQVAFNVHVVLVTALMPMDTVVMT